MKDLTRQPTFVQVVVSRAREGAAHDDVLRLARSLQRWVEQQPGFVRRRLLSTGDGGYVDVVEWTDQAAAQAAQAAPDHPGMAEMARVLAVESMTVTQGTVVALVP